MLVSADRIKTCATSGRVAMPKRMIAKIGLALALILIADFSASVSYDQARYSLRRRIGRIFLLPPFVLPFVPRGPHVGHGRRGSYDYYGERRAVSPVRGQLGSNEIVSSLQGRGFRDISPPQHRGATYILEATGPQGERVRLIVNALSGGIDGVRVIGRPRPF